MRLQRLGFFETVDMTPRSKENPDELRMNVEVTEQPTGSFSVGMGFSNLEKFCLYSQHRQEQFFGTRLCDESISQCFIGSGSRGIYNCSIHISWTLVGHSV